jgi:hypothetical protein
MFTEGQVAWIKSQTRYLDRLHQLDLRLGSMLLDSKPRQRPENGPASGIRGTVRRHGFDQPVAGPMVLIDRSAQVIQGYDPELARSPRAAFTPSAACH